MASNVLFRGCQAPDPTCGVGSVNRARSNGMTDGPNRAGRRTRPSTGNVVMAEG